MEIANELKIVKWRLINCLNGYSDCVSKLKS